MAIQSNFPAIKPSLMLDFANTKQLDPRITFTRASTATYYDGVTTSKAEENLFTYSQEFDNAAWTKIRASITANTVTAPDGTITADTLTEDTSSSGKYVRQSPTVAAGAYTTSVYAKANTRSWMAIRIYDGSADKYAYFDLSTGALGTVDAGVTATITSVGSGWYRCTHTYTLTAGSREFQFMISDGNNTANSYTGNGTSSIYLWGGQLEQRSAVIAYTVTTTQVITNYIPKLQTAVSGVARFDHNPVTDESLGLLIEEQRTNLVTYSEQFDNAAWTKTAASITANTIVSPDGTVNADKLVEDTATSAHGISATTALTTTTSASYSISFYAKQAERNFIQIFFTGGHVTGNPRANYDLNTGALGTVDSGITASITAVGNGWYRCVATVVAATTALRPFFNLVTSSSAVRNESYTGNGFSGIYIWGAQLEAGAFATSYIPTVASQVTRSLDSASMTGTNFSTWFNAGEGTIYGEYNTGTNSGIADGAGNGRGVLNISDGTSANRLRFAASINSFQVVTNNTTVANIAIGTVAANTTYKMSSCYKVDDFQASRDNVLGTADTSGQVPLGLNAMNIGTSNVASGILGGTIKKIAYYPMRVTNTNLQALTS